jgi:hypothetical protein
VRGGFEMELSEELVVSKIRRTWFSVLARMA